MKKTEIKLFIYALKLVRVTLPLLFLTSRAKRFEGKDKESPYRASTTAS